MPCVSESGNTASRTKVAVTEKPLGSGYVVLVLCLYILFKQF